MSPINIRARGLLFQPRTKPLWTFDTPIRQMATSCPTPPEELKKGYFLAVRTYGRVHIFDLRHQIASDRTKSPYALSEVAKLGIGDFDDETVMDMAFSHDSPVDLYLITKPGSSYRFSLREDHHAL